MSSPNFHHFGAVLNLTSQWLQCWCCVLVAELRADIYWRTPFQRLCDVRQLTRFIVMDLEMISLMDRRHIPGQGHESFRVWVEDIDSNYLNGDCWYINTESQLLMWHVFVLQHALADAWVVKEREIGIAEQQIHCRTHLGHLLTPGDVVLGSVTVVSHSVCHVLWWMCSAVPWADMYCCRPFQLASHTVDDALGSGPVPVI